MSRLRILAGFLLLALLGAISGCNKTAVPTLAPTPAPTELPTRTMRLFWLASYDADDIWSQGVQTGLKEELARSGYVAGSSPSGQPNLIVGSFYLDAAHHQGRKELQTVAEEAIAAILEFQPDLVVVSDDEAAELVIRLYPDRSLPFIYAGITGDPHSAALALPSATGVLEQPHGVQTVRLARAMVTDAKRYMILSDASDSGWAIALALYHQLGAAGLTAEPPRLRVIGDWESWQRAVITETADVDFILLGRHEYLFDNYQQELDSREIFNWTWNNSPVPLFAISEGSVQSGAVGGLTLSSYEQGREAGRIVLRIWNGAYPSDIRAHAPERNVLAINVAGARHWGLPVAIEFPIAARIYRAQPEGGR